MTFNFDCLNEPLITDEENDPIDLIAFVDGRLPQLFSAHIVHGDKEGLLTFSFNLPDIPCTEREQRGLLNDTGLSTR